jgi:hypothetical protein
MNAIEQHQQKALQDAIAEMQEAEPNLSFTAAWSKLRKEKPHLFAELPTAASYQPSPEQAKAGKIWRAQRVIHAELVSLQQEENLTFQDAWNRLKRRRPDLFRALGVAAGANVRLVKCDDDSPGDDDSPDYIMIRAEDADELEAEVAAGLWS